MKKFGIFFTFVLLIMAGIFLSPYYALYQLKSSIENGDGEKVVSYLNVPKIQTSLQTELTARLQHTLTTNPTLATLDKFMPKLKDDLATKAQVELDNSIAAALTANNLQKTLSGELTNESKKLVALWAVASDYVDYELLIKDAISKLGNTEKMIKNQEPIIKERIAKRFGNVPTDTTLRYCGVHCFEVAGAVAGVPVEATLHRVGVVGWQVDEIKLP